MTTILGIRSGGVSYLAADSRICAGNPLPVCQRKIVEAGPWALAHSGEVRMVNLMEEHREALWDCGDIGALCRLLREIVEKDGWQRATEKGSPNWGNLTLLVAHASGLWHVGCDFSYSPVEDGRITGAGSGSEYALGAFEGFIATHVHIEDRMRHAIMIASGFDPGTDDRVQLVRVVEAGGGTFLDSLSRLPVERHEITYANSAPVFISREQLSAPLPPEEEEKLRRIDCPICGGHHAGAGAGICPHEDDGAARMLGFPNAVAAREIGVCPCCGRAPLGEGHATGCKYYRVPAVGEPAPCA